MFNKIEFDQYEYDRMSFFISLVRNGDRQFLNSNREFFSSLQNKFLNKVNKNNFDLFQDTPSNSDLIFKNYEILNIFSNFQIKFKDLYNSVTSDSYNKSKDGYEYKNSTYYMNKKMLEDLYFVYLPISRYIYKKSYSEDFSKTSLILGIQAHQGCGKTTMTSILKYLLENVYEVKTEVLSIDDLYLPYEELKRLKETDNSYRYRGPPGTHDLALMTDILNKIKGNFINVSLPRYDKSAYGGLGDRFKIPKYNKTRIDVLLFEGWFLGASPVSESELATFQKDKEKLEFQIKINNNLKEYQSVFNLVDNWIILRPFKFEYSRMWRAKAEKANKQGMNYKTMQDFLDYFWLSLPPNIYFKKLEAERKPIFTIALDKFRNYHI